MYPITDEAHLLQLYESMQTQRSQWRHTGRFSRANLAEAQAVLAKLPNFRTEFGEALKDGDAADLDGENLRLEGIGWIDRRISQMDVPRRVSACEIAIARLKDITDPLLLASARRLAESLPNLRDDWTDRLAPLVQWAHRHAEEIQEMESA
jgi:hypothetical protein